MDYEKKYKDALERAEKALEVFGTDKCEGARQIFSLFPELKESEDELTWLIKYIEEEVHSLSMDIRDNEDRIKLKNLRKSLAWLEKQGQTYTKRDVDDAWLKGMCDAKRELEKQDEQKPAEKIEPFDKYEGLTDFERTLADICIGWIGEEFGWKQYIKDNADALLKIAVEKFNSVQDVPFEQNPATSYCQEHCKGYQETGKCFADGDCKDKRKAEQKPSWSEEDERMCQETIDWFEKKCFPYALESENPARESIKWLKSLKDRYTWKPSDEQIEALDSATENCAYSEYQDCLRELIGQLKKLREE